jgi:hypothetical protein
VFYTRPHRAVFSLAAMRRGIQGEIKKDWYVPTGTIPVFFKKREKNVKKVRFRLSGA